MKLDAEVLVELICKWGRDRGLNDPKSQLNKAIEELGELAHEICRNRYNTPELKDAIGDTIVTLIILADTTGNDPIDCLQLAYDAIKDRTGVTKGGAFIKDEADR